MHSEGRVQISSDHPCPGKVVLLAREGIRLALPGFLGPAHTRVDAHERVDEVLGGPPRAVGGRRGHQAVAGPTGLQLLLRDGPWGSREAG